MTPISQASANQRAGRAGRVAKGVCYRLYTEHAFHSDMPVRTVPEMQRSDLGGAVLQLKALGVDDVLHFDFLSPPPPELMARALELLYAAGALDEHCRLTAPLGTLMVEFPVDPRLARMLVAAGEMRCMEEALSIAAMLSVQSVFLSPRSGYRSAEKAKAAFSAREGDHVTLLNVFDSFLSNRRASNWCEENYLNKKALSRAVDIRAQLKRYLTRFKIPIESCVSGREEGWLVWVGGWVGG